MHPFVEFLKVRLGSIISEVSVVHWVATVVLQVLAGDWKAPILLASPHRHRPHLPTTATDTVVRLSGPPHPNSHMTQPDIANSRVHFEMR